MFYVALLVGAGEGCDYTIGCNKKWVNLKATTKEEAMNEAAQLWEDHGGGDLLEKITILRVDSQDVFDPTHYKAKREAEE